MCGFNRSRDDTEGVAAIEAGDYTECVAAIEVGDHTACVASIEVETPLRVCLQ